MNSAAKWAANPADKEHRVCQRGWPYSQGQIFIFMVLLLLTPIYP